MKRNSGTTSVTFTHYGTGDEELEVIAMIHEDGEVEIESIEDSRGLCLNEDTIGQYGCTWTEIESAAYDQAIHELSEPEGDDSGWDSRCD